MVARDLPQKFRLRIGAWVKTFSGKKTKIYRKLNFKKQLPSAQNWNFFSCYFWCPCVPRVLNVRTDMFLPVIFTNSNADLQYMIKSYIWTTEKNSGLLSGVGLKTAIITSTWCSTPSTTRTTCRRILCNKKTTTNKQLRTDKILKSGHFGEPI